MGNMVEFPSNEQKVTGYLALPGDAKGPGVLVLHAWWGLNSVFKTLCDRLAAEGFVAFAPDLFHGRVATTIDEAEQLSSSLEQKGDQAYAEITASVTYLLVQPQIQGKEIGVIGFSMGGYWALLLENSVGAIVTFYGLGDPNSVTAQAAFLGHFAEHDEFESIEAVHQMEEHIRSLGKEVSFTIYPGTRHWFFEENRPEYDANAAKQAWDATVQFLQQHLRKTNREGKDSKMGTPISKTQLLAELNDENASWEALLNDIGKANMTQPEVAGGWSIKDIVAHITGWRRRTVNRFQAALNRTNVPPPPWPPELQEVDQINAWIYEANRDRPLADVLSDSREVFQQLFAAIDAFSDDELHDPQRFAWLEGEPLSGSFVFSHFHEEHEPDMRAWLERVKRGS